MAHCATGLVCHQVRFLLHLLLLLLGMGDAVELDMKTHSLCLHALLGVVLAACSGSDDPNPAAGGAAGSTSQPDSGTESDAQGGSDSGTTDSGTEPDSGLSPTMAKSSAERDPASDSTIAAVVDADNAFAFDLYAKVADEAGTDNAVMSPQSVSLALAMTYAGAQNTTADEMAETMHWDGPGVDVHGGHNALSQALATRAAYAFAAAEQNAQDMGEDPPSLDDFRVHVVNSVWGDGSYTWEQPFLDTLAQSYGTGVYLADFINQPNPERVRINSWVSEETQDKINDLIPDGAVNSDTRMVLVNAMHLKLPWEIPFQQSATEAGDFTTADGSTVSADFMSQQASLAYYEDDKAQIASLPLVGRQMSLVVALPKGDLASFEADMDTDYWNSTWEARSSQEVEIELPKFSFTTASIKLRDIFESLGMQVPFVQAEADFYGMCSNPPNNERLFIADIIHKAMMAVDENGVEAAAATAVLMSGGTSVPPTPVPMVVDKPFVVAIVDEPTGSILFLGRITDPTQEGSP